MNRGSRGGRPTGIQVFGPHWDAPVTRWSERVEPPLGQRCVFCDEPVAEGERGMLVPVTVGPRPHRAVLHLECELRATMGTVEHLEMRCTCVPGFAPIAHETGAIHFRAEARRVMAWVEHNGTIP